MLIEEVPYASSKITEGRQFNNRYAPPSVIEALHLHENDELAVEVARDRIMLTRATTDFQDAWNAYQEIEPRYRNANRKLSE